MQSGTMRASSFTAGARNDFLFGRNAGAVHLSFTHGTRKLATGPRRGIADEAVGVHVPAQFWRISAASGGLTAERQETAEGVVSLEWGSDLESVYEVGDVLGAGRQGVVWEAKNKSTGEEFAVKAVTKCDIARKNPAAMKRMKSEAVIMAQLQDCEFVARLENVFEDDENIFVVMERLRGGTLGESLEKHGKFSEREALRVMHGVFSFLAECHAAGYCYGDVKPANFMLKDGACDEAGRNLGLRVKAVDFGCSQKVVPGLRLRNRTGSPLYMAPEVHLGGYGVESDLWSAGVMLFQLLSGEAPFVKTDDNGVLIDVGVHLGYSFDSENWAQVSEEAKELIRQLLVRDRTSRITASNALRHSWFQASNVVAAGDVSSLLTTTLHPAGSV